MDSSGMVTRRRFLQAATVAAAAAVGHGGWRAETLAAGLAKEPLKEFGYGEVTLQSELHETQRRATHDLLMGLDEDSLLKPFRQMVGQEAPGEELGGWYKYDPNYDWHTFDAGFAPSATFGQWVSALARNYAITGSAETREKVLRLNRLYAKTIAPDFYDIKNRFPAYCYDKLVCGLIDAHEFAGDADAYKILEETTKAAATHLPGKAIEHGKSWRPGTDESYTWDESYTISENLFLAYQRGAGERYREMGRQYLDDEYYGPLAEGRDDLAGRHAYSHVNSLCSAMQAYLTLGSEKHLRAARNGFEMLKAQSFVTGGWGPDETLRAPKSPDVANSLTNSHSSFETPCGAYAHMKLTRYLLRVTGESRYGDSMERVMYNTILGAKPMMPDGRTFYYSDYNFSGKRVYSPHRWPCCSGTMPEVAADYRINTYFRDRQGVYVNLYIPSTARWKQGDTAVLLKQESNYPDDNPIAFEVTVSKPVEFALNLRVPEWATGATIALNGRQTGMRAVPGSFTKIQRQWKTGERVELDLPMKLRLEAVDAENPNTVALVRGPIVLFAITKERPQVTRQQLLTAKRMGGGKWEAETSSGALLMMPFTGIEEEQYSTYLMVS